VLDVGKVGVYSWGVDEFLCTVSCNFKKGFREVDFVMLEVAKRVC
jgi:hypothetical protein